jgi:triacylglycerol lipase
VKTDLDAMPVDTGRGMKVHQGFQRALDEVWQDLLDALKPLHSPSRTLWMTGHSLGAALATLAAERYKNVQGLYTFGSPRVGDSRFRVQFPAKGYRLVHNNDIVTELPLPGIYFHVGELWYIDSQGELHHDSKFMEMFSDGVRAEARNIKQAFENAPSGEFQFVPGGIKDHVPLFYTLHLWNALEEHRSDKPPSSNSRAVFSPQSSPRAQSATED